MSPYRPQYANDECGRGTRGAWGAGTPPTVYRVSNLNDSGAGSLRDALEASGPRVVVFETSGAIIARSDYTISQPVLHGGGADRAVTRHHAARRSVRRRRRPAACRSPGTMSSSSICASGRATVRRSSRRPPRMTAWRSSTRARTTS